MIHNITDIEYESIDRPYIDLVNNSTPLKEKASFKDEIDIERCSNEPFKFTSLTNDPNIKFYVDTINFHYKIHFKESFLVNTSNLSFTMLKGTNSGTMLRYRMENLKN